MVLAIYVAVSSGENLSAYKIVRAEYPMLDERLL
jgi:hypothetical protein